MTPQRTDLVLTADVPNSKADVLVLHSLHVEADGGDGGDHLAKLELVEHGGLAGVVEAKQKNAHLLVRLALQLAQ